MLLEEADAVMIHLILESQFATTSLALNPSVGAFSHMSLVSFSCELSSTLKRAQEQDQRAGLLQVCEDFVV